MDDRRKYFTYIMASRSRTIYIGVTGNLRKRVLDHKAGKASAFTTSYQCNRLVWFAEFQYVGNAIALEKRLKGWLRERKLALVEEANAPWLDLADGWFSDEQIARWREG